MFLQGVTGHIQYEILSLVPSKIFWLDEQKHENYENNVKKVPFFTGFHAKFVFTFTSSLNTFPNANIHYLLQKMIKIWFQ